MTPMTLRRSTTSVTSKKNQRGHLAAGEWWLLFLFALVVGWSGYVLLVPRDTPRDTPTLRPDEREPNLTLLYERIRESTPIPAAPAWSVDALRPDWRYITVHHSATTAGSARAFDRYHRTKKHPMENGLAYHFVIGNGNGSGDGEVEAGGRWTKQLDGGHVKGDDLNAVSIGICLVGDFERFMPTEKQLASLKGLLNYLLDTTAVDDEHVLGHGHMPKQQTKCPGRYLPVGQVVRHRRGPGTAP